VNCRTFAHQPVVGVVFRVLLLCSTLLAFGGCTSIPAEDVSQNESKSPEAEIFTCRREPSCPSSKPYQHCDAAGRCFCTERCGTVCISHASCGVHKPKLNCIDSRCNCTERCGTSCSRYSGCEREVPYLNCVDGDCNCTSACP
jgi:hypothetical protein